MFSRIDKTWVAAAVSFLSLSALQFFNIQIDATVQNGIIAVVTAALVWLVPNKA
jgi:hypothetical protein